MTPVQTISLNWIPVLLLLVFLLVPVLGEGALLDEESPPDPFLDLLVSELHSFEIDVARNLNQRDIARGRPARPRLGGFPDLPIKHLPDSVDLLAFEQDLASGAIGALVLIASEGAQDAGSVDFLARWKAVPAEQRVFIVFHESDANTAESLGSVLQNQGFALRNLGLEPGADAAAAGRLFVLAGRRLAIDSVSARRHRSDLREFQYLGKRLGRDEQSLVANYGRLPAGRNEPSVFRKASLGDEFEASTIEEIIVPGGIALGEVAELDFEPRELRYQDGRLTLITTDDVLLPLPVAGAQADLKALWDFVARAEALNSDAVVDIDGDGRVRISDALRDTDVGYHLLELDILPFEFVRNLPVTKSVIIDTGVRFTTTGDGQAPGIETTYEVRFLSADTMRIAQTRVALEFQWRGDSELPRYLDQWGRDTSRLDENLDTTGLGISTAAVAQYGAWIALLRRLQQDQVRFVEGRYEFMKIDKSGRRTPARF